MLAMVLSSAGLMACGSADKKTSPSSTVATSNVTSSSDTASDQPGATGSSSGPVESKGSSTSPKLGYKTFGPVADTADRQKVATIVKRYYAAAAADDATAACSLLYTDIARSVAEDYGHSPGSPYLHGNTCVEVLSKLFKHRNGQPTADLSTIQVAGVRVNNDEEALALLRLPRQPYGEISLHRQGGSWRVIQLLGGPLR